MSRYADWHEEADARWQLLQEDNPPAQPPTMRECTIERTPIPAPAFVCWHPDAEPGFNLYGTGATPEAAHRDMLEALKDWWDAHHDQA